MTPSEAGKLGAKKILENNIKKYNENPNYCKLCGKKIELTEGVIPSIIRQKKYCSKECKNKAQSIRMQNNAAWTGNVKKGNYKLKNKICINCGKSLNANSHKYCSKECETEYRQNDYIKKWKNGEINGMRGDCQISEHIRKYMFEKCHYKCELCGWDKINPYTQKHPLEVHHKDGNYLNNKEENLQVLCPCCHSLTPNYGSRNKNGRKPRYKNKQKTE